jgi:Flp pilus assembly protein TadG
MVFRRSIVRGSNSVDGTETLSALRILLNRVHAPVREREEGASVIELALVLPMLLLLTTGILVSAVAMNTYLQITQAASSGARLVAISRGQTLDPCATVAGAVYAAAPGLTESKFTFSYAFNGAPFSGTTCSSTSTTTGAPGDLVQGTAATVTVSYPCNLSVLGKNYAPGCTLTTQTTEIVQ